MKQYIRLDEWRILEEGFHPAFNRVSESLFSLGNGHMGVRGNFEEPYSGDSLPGSYIGGIYFPEAVPGRRRKVGLPEQIMRMANAANWIGIHVEFDGEALDLARCHIGEFRRLLDLKGGVLERTFQARLSSGKEVRVHATRFCSLAEDEIGVIRYAVTPLNFSGTLTLTPFIDLNVTNELADGEEDHWVEVETMVRRSHAYLVSETRKTEFQVCTGMKFVVLQNGQVCEAPSYRIQREKYVACSVDLPCYEGEETVLIKYVANLSSLHHPKEGLLERCKYAVKQAARRGFGELLSEHQKAWEERWAAGDVEIAGDVPAQQAIRFNIFHLHQAYHGRDERLSVSPKGFTGERYGGCTYWSAEAFCLPFFLGMSGAEAGRRMLLYRYNHLPHAIANAARLGLPPGAALYPMVTMNGEECSTDWEIALAAIHRNGAVAYAVYDYVRQTGDERFLVEHGLEMLIAIARYWAGRVHFSEARGQYLIHGVTGPNEYDNNVNNNWYTNYLAAWCLRYTLEVIDYVRDADPDAWEALAERIDFDGQSETGRWREIIDRLYLPYDEALGIFPQHEGYLDKNLPLVSDLHPQDRPLYQHWSWDRILRSGFVKRADVLQGLFTFAPHFDEATLRRNFNFYEPRTVHESSLSPGVHAALAARLGQWDKAYALFLRGARLDLDDYNGDTADGCHVTSMAGAWLALVRGFAGVWPGDDGVLRLQPAIPPNWASYRLRLLYRGRRLELRVDQHEVRLRNLSDEPFVLDVYGEVFSLDGRAEWACARKRETSGLL